MPSETDHRPSPWRAVALALVVAGSYWWARQALYRGLPVTDERPLSEADHKAVRQAGGDSAGPPRSIAGWDVVYEDFMEKGPHGSTLRGIRPVLLQRLRQDLWLRRDLLCGGLRLAALAACLLAARACGGLSAWGWRWSWSRAGAGVLLLDCAAFLLDFVVRTGGRDLSEIPAAVLWALNAPVGFFEEACFRGLLFLGLAERAGARRAALLSSLVFTIWHWGAQPVHAWPWIFLWGVSACAALRAGLGLPWLGLIHWNFDAATMLLTGRTEPALLWDWVSLAGCFLAALWGWRILGREAPPRGGLS